MSGATPAYVARAREQIRRGEDLARTTGAPRDEAVDAAHFLIEDGGAARQGDDPAVLLRTPALAHLYPEAQRVERAAVLGWDAATFRKVLASLRSLGASRMPDVARLTTIRGAS